MKKLAVCFAILCGAVAAVQAGDGWLVDFAAAKAAAKESGRPILMDFTGSDWCGWCIKLDKEVFGQAEFDAYAKSSLVLFKADFPMRKALPDAEKKQNESLMERFGVQGFPTIVLVDAEGKEIARTGYQPGGAAAYVEHLKGLLANRK